MSDAVFNTLTLGTDSPAQERLRVAFDKLMHELNGSLDAKNRDKFMQNLTAFRHDIKQLL